MIAGLLDHIWQSTLFAGGVAFLILFFRRNGAAVRFWLWFAASVKFLVPFAGLAALGDYLSGQFPASLPSSLLAIQPAAVKLSAPASLLVAPQGIDLAPLLLCVWLLGFAAILGLRSLRWLRLRALMADAHDVPAPGPMPVRIKASPSLLEPGLVGIMEPVVLLPQELMARLSQAERDSILAHELSHLSRRDNVTAAIHMAVEALFWFYPPVWLIGAQLIAERERACDETVVAGGHDPEVYAGGILKVCKFCVQSPLACASGASGADLKQRVRWIMSTEAVLDLHAFQRLLLAGTAVLALSVPMVAGFRNTPLAVTVKQVMAVQARAERAVTAVAEQIGIAPVRHVTVKKLPRLTVKVAAALPSLPLIETPAAPQSDVLVPQAPPPAPAAPIAASAAALPSATRQMALALNPTGSGDPDAVTCRIPQLLPGSRLAGPTVCQPNRVWAELYARHRDISPDGTAIVMLDGSQRYMDVHGCSGVRAVAGTTSNFAALPANFCF